MKIPNLGHFNFEHLKMTAILRGYGVLLNPLVAIVSPTVVEFGEKRTVIKVPLNYLTRNHLGTMYFGAINIGAELSIAAVAFLKIKESGLPVDFIFKDFSAKYLKRAEGDVHFIFEQNNVVAEQLSVAGASDERVNRTLTAYAIVPSQNKDEVIAEFVLTLSMRRRNKFSKAI
jgi:hypothetical protein